MCIREQGTLDLQKLVRVISEILSDRYGAEITVTVRPASTCHTAWNSGDDAGNTRTC